MVKRTLTRSRSLSIKIILVFAVPTAIPLSRCGAQGKPPVEPAVNQAAEGQLEEPADAAAGPPKSRQLPARVAFDFRKGHFDREHLLPVGNLSLYSWTLIRPEDAGLRITIPSHQGRDKSTLGVAPTFNVHGDFEITATYELLDADTPTIPKAVGGQLYILTNGKHNGASSCAGSCLETRKCTISTGLSVTRMVANRRN